MTSFEFRGKPIYVFVRENKNCCCLDEFAGLRLSSHGSI